MRKTKIPGELHGAAVRPARFTITITRSDELDGPWTFDFPVQPAQVTFPPPAGRAYLMTRMGDELTARFTAWWKEDGALVIAERVLDA